MSGALAGRAWGAGLGGVALLAARGALRTRLVPLSALLLLGVLGGLASSGLGDESPAGRLRAYLSLGGSFVSFLLALGAIFLPSRLAGDLRLGRLVQLTSGPLSRGALVAAWWAGTLAVLVALCGLAYLALGIGAEAVLRLGEGHGVDPELLRSGVLRGRAIARAEAPAPEAILALAEAEYAERLARGALPADLDPEEALERLRAGYELEARSLRPGEAKRWGVEALERDPSELRLRFRFSASWPRWKPLNERAVPLQVRVEAEGKLLWEAAAARYLPNTPYELPVPVGQISGPERLELVIVNGAGDGASVVLPREGPSLLYPAGGFALNLVRAAWVEVCRLAFLVAVGVVMAALFDARLAMLAVLWVVALGYGQGFLSESLRPGMFGPADAAILGLLKGVLWCVPDLGRAELGGTLAGGEAIPGAWLRSGTLDLVLRAPALVLLGGLAFGRRELGALR